MCWQRQAALNADEILAQAAPIFDQIVQLGWLRRSLPRFRHPGAAEQLRHHRPLYDIIDDVLRQWWPRLRHAPDQQRHTFFRIRLGMTQGQLFQRRISLRHLIDRCATSSATATTFGMAQHKNFRQSGDSLRGKWEAGFSHGKR